MNIAEQVHNKTSLRVPFLYATVGSSLHAIPVVTQLHLTFPTKPGGVFTPMTCFAVSTTFNSSLENFPV